MALIALLTDFGTRDYYVAAMKGVILSISPNSTLVDITHEIPPQNVTAGAFELVACYRDFPPGTIFLVVIDPGVGTDRKAIAVRCGDYYFVAPDNGVLAPVLESRVAEIVELTEARFSRPNVSSTFEGRDRFAPAAAWLAEGTELRSLGRPLAGVVRLTTQAARRVDGGVEGAIVKTDRFGNLVTNVDGGVLDSIRTARTRVLVAGYEIGGIVRTYAQVPAGALCALVGSSGYLEISVNGGSAAERLGVREGAAVSVFA